MSDPTLARTERAALATLFQRVGPDAPTLCEGWNSRDLLHHLLVRERNPLASVGQFVPPLHGLTDRAVAEYAARPWSSLVAELRSGPPMWHPFSWGPVDARVNGLEFFIHHEDVRRGGDDWEPRVLDAATEDQLRAALRSGFVKLLARRLPVGVVAVLPDGSRTTVRSGDPQVEVVGEPGEFILWLAGREKVQLSFDGPADAVTRLRAAVRSM
ncbi:TIGR03085 family protein [Nakamurella flava]|uniref:TIGR03085 family protein n=1 Tax=Nakamurella flava TaxID=2576308 RepID=A0A4U6QKX4_9ACTN|nr:TIGR03085 family metal-binding protein [Nakamurella flava]TKV60939.1 TIGR03085 family protein [Nakamurella flava]